MLAITKYLAGITDKDLKNAKEFANGGYLTYLSDKKKFDELSKSVNKVKEAGAREDGCLSLLFSAGLLTAGVIAAYMLKANIPTTDNNPVPVKTQKHDVSTASATDTVKTFIIQQQKEK